MLTRWTSFQNARPLIHLSRKRASPVRKALQNSARSRGIFRPRKWWSQPSNASGLKYIFTKHLRHKVYNCCMPCKLLLSCNLWRVLPWSRLLTWIMANNRPLSDFMMVELDATPYLCPAQIVGEEQLCFTEKFLFVDFSESTGYQNSLGALAAECPKWCLKSSN